MSYDPDSSHKKLNLPDGISQLYQRRYSDPVKQPTAKTTPEDLHPRMRRFSLSTFDDLKDISSGKIRSCVNKILRSSGFTAFTKAKSSQMRRYSIHVDPEVENNLGDDLQRPGTSFFIRVTNQIENTANERNNSCDVNMGKNKMLGKRSLICYPPKDTSEEEFHTIPCRTNDTPSSTSPEMYYYNHRLLKQMKADEYDCPPIPKCKYKLRENGMVASEMVSCFGVQIEEASVLTSNTMHDVTLKTATPRSSKMSVSQKQSPIRSISNPTLKQASVKSTPPRRLLNRSTSLPIEETAYFFQSTGISKSTLKQGAHNNDTMYKVLEPNLPAFLGNPDLKRSSHKHILDRRNSQLNFEMIGSKTLHGCPKYSGRLKLCTFRSFVDG